MEAIKQLTTQGVQEVIEPKVFADTIEDGHPLVVKLGVDPTSKDLHLGHAVVLRKLKQFADLGHQTVLVIGDFTAGIGDPAGVKTSRPVLSREQIRENMATYLEQAGKILDLERTKVSYNSEWLDQMKLADLLAFANRIGVSTIIERDDFKARLEANEFIGLHELLYPLVQAIDSFHLKADIEIGGWDQRLNLLMGRELQKKCDQAPQQVVLMKPLVGLDGERKMSSSYGNYIGLTETADQMFGKIMSIRDEQTAQWAELAGWMSGEAVEQLKDKHPKDAKIQVAQAVVSLYYGSYEATKTSERFTQTFGNKEVNTRLAESVSTLDNNREVTVVELIAKQMQISKSEATRLIQQGAVRLMGHAVTDPNMTPAKYKEQVLQVGKHRFFRLQ